MSDDEGLNVNSNNVEPEASKPLETSNQVESIANMKSKPHIKDVVS